MTTPAFTRTDQRALLAVAAQFFVNGALFASFIPRLPEIRDRVDISVSDVGLLMSVAGATGLIASAVVGRWIERAGTKRVMLVAGTLVAASLPLVGLATTPWVLLIGLASMLAFDVPVDVAMNLQGSWLSGRRHSPVMNRLHGLWSLGTAVGGITSSRLAAAGVGLGTHLTVAGIVLFGVVLVANRQLLVTDEHPSQTTGAERAAPSTRSRFSPALVLFMLAGLFSVAIESTSIDWAAFRFTDDFDTSPAVAALAYVAVTTGMTVGRFGGDAALIRVGEDRLMALAIGATAIGLSMATLVDIEAVSLVGYGLAGLGISTMLPGLYDQAAKHPGRAGAGLGALTAGIRTSVLTVPLTVGALAGTSLAVGDAVAMLTLPSIAGFALVVAAIKRQRS